MSTPDRKVERLFSRLAGFKGVLQVDGYSAYPKLADVDPLAYLTDVLTRIVNGHPNHDTEFHRTPTHTPEKYGISTKMNRS